MLTLTACYLCVSSRPTKLKLSLLTNLSLPASCGPTLVPLVSRNTFQQTAHEGYVTAKKQIRSKFV